MAGADNEENPAAVAGRATRGPSQQTGSKPALQHYAPTRDIWDLPPLPTLLAERDLGGVLRYLMAEVGYTRLALASLPGLGASHVIDRAAAGAEIRAVSVLRQTVEALGIPPGLAGLAFCSCTNHQCGGARLPVSRAGEGVMRPPAAVWREPEMRELLAADAFGGVVQYLIQRCCYSPTYLAGLPGLKKRPPNEIVRRPPTHLRTVERLVTALGIPPGLAGLAFCSCTDHQCVDTAAADPSPAAELSTVGDLLRAAGAAENPTQVAAAAGVSPRVVALLLDDQPQFEGGFHVGTIRSLAQAVGIVPRTLLMAAGFTAEQMRVADPLHEAGVTMRSSGSPDRRPPSWTPAAVAHHATREMHLARGHAVAVELGRRIRDRRIAAGLTMRELGDLMPSLRTGRAVDDLQVWNWEVALARPDLYQLLRLCDALGCHISDLLRGIETSEPSIFPRAADDPVYRWPAPSPGPPVATCSSITETARDVLRQRVADEYRAGASIRAIMAMLDRSYGFVHTLLEESGIPFRSRGSAGPRPQVHE